MRFIKQFLLGLLVASPWASTALADTPPAAVLAAAQSGFRPFIASLSPEDCAAYGIAPNDPNLQLGQALAVKEITNTSLANYKSGNSVQSLLTTTTAWYFLVEKAGQTKLILVVDTINGQWSVVSAGMSQLGNEIGGLVKSAGRAQGATFVQVPQASQAFVYLNPSTAMTRYAASVAQSDSNNLIAVGKGPVSANASVAVPTLTTQMSPMVSFGMSRYGSNAVTAAPTDQRLGQIVSILQDSAANAVH